MRPSALIIGREMIDAIPDGIMTIDTELRVVHANASIEALLGKDPATFVGKPFRDIVSSTDMMRTVGLDELLDDSDADTITITFTGTQGAVCTQVTVAKVVVEGAVQGFIALLRDDSEIRHQLAESIAWVSLETERASMEAQRAQEQAAAKTALEEVIAERDRMEAELRQTQKLQTVGQLAAGIAHEINTPIQFMESNTSFLRRAFKLLISVVEEAQELVSEPRAHSGDDPDHGTKKLSRALKKARPEFLRAEVPKALQQTTEGIERVATIVGAMKDFARPPATAKEFFDLNAGISTTATIARSEWGTVADLVLDLGEEMTMVECFPSDINQVILSLIVNASHAIADSITPGSSERGEIKVSSRLRGHQVEVSVSDTGTGIPVGVRERVFDPFFTTKEVGKGTGQGLSLAHHVVANRHGGTLDFQTEEGVGTTFFVRLPVGTRSA